MLRRYRAAPPSQHLPGTLVLFELLLRIPSLEFHQATPRGTCFFDLGVITPKQATLAMEKIIEMTCSESKGEFVNAGTRRSKPGHVHICRFDASIVANPSGSASDLAATFVSDYVCNIEPIPNASGREAGVRLRLHWNQGGEHEQFYQFSQMMLDQVVKLYAD